MANFQERIYIAKREATISKRLGQRGILPMEIRHRFIPTETLKNPNIAKLARAYKFAVNADGTGDFKTIQQAIDAARDDGGGKVFLKNGVYFQTSDLNLYNKVSLVGESPGGVIIHFAGTASSIVGKGTEIYETGTVAVTKGSTTVTGTGTAWSTNLTVDHNIIINNVWFGIDSILSDTSLILDSKYYDATDATASYTSAKFLSYFDINNLILVGTTTNALELDHCDTFTLEDIVVLAAGNNGVNLVDCASFNLASLVLDDNGGSGLYMDSCQLFGMTYMDLRNNTSHGWHALNTESGGLSVSGAFNNGGSGLYFDTSGAISLRGVEADGNTDYGIYATAAVEGIDFVSMGVANNGSDGIRLDGDSNDVKIIAAAINDNGGWGIKINHANCNDTHLVANTFSGNTSGRISDSGTDTVDLTDPPVRARSYTVANLPSSGVTAGQTAYASNGRKAGEGAGAGTGVLAFYDQNSNWIAVDTGATVAA